MKQLIILTAMVLGFTFSVNAQTTPEKVEATKVQTTKMVDHGEKGHTCTADCKEMESDNAAMPLKDHVCTDACDGAGKCVMAHGEKGHVCGSECKGKM